MAVRLATTRRAQRGVFWGGPRMSGVTIRMIGLEGRLQWRQHKLFKLHAKLPQCEKTICYNGLILIVAAGPWSGSAFKICDSPNPCAAHKHWADALEELFRRLLSPSPPSVLAHRPHPVSS